MSADTAASTPPATTVPAMRPRIAHLMPRTSIARRSRQAINSVSTSVQTRMGAGTKRGSSRMRSGAASSPMPNPIAPCSVAPTNVSVVTSTMSARGKTPQVYSGGGVP